ncbi:hypothetical protein [Pedobacter caeni]|nr:hypothetical protein [Pedobacter caeni]
MKNSSSAFLLTVTLLLSFFMLSGNTGFSAISAHKPQTEVLAGFKPLSVRQVNYYDNRNVLKYVHFLSAVVDQAAALTAFNRSVEVAYALLQKDCSEPGPSNHFYLPKIVSSQSQDEEAFLLIG